MHKSGCTSEKLKPEADTTLAETHNMSITNFIARPTSAVRLSHIALHQLNNRTGSRALQGRMDRSYSPVHAKAANLSTKVRLFPSSLHQLISLRIIACLGKRVYTTLQTALAKPSRSTTSSYFPHPPKVASKVVMGLQKIRFRYASGISTIVFALPSPSGLETHYRSSFFSLVISS